MFEGIDIKKLFKNSEYAKKYTFGSITEEMIRKEFRADITKEEMIL